LPLKLIRLTTVPISLYSLIKGQPKYLQEQGFEVKLASADGKETALIENETGIRVDTFPFTRTISPFTDLKALWLTYNYFRREKPQIVHTHTPKAGTIGMLAAWLARVPARLHTVAGLPLMETKGTKRIFLDAVEKTTYACATKVYPNSFGLKDIIVENGYCKPSKLKVIGNGSSNGIDTRHFSKEALPADTLKQIKSECQIGKDDFIFIFIGRLVKDKGIQELIAAFEKLNTIYPQAKLILVGNEEPELGPLDKQTKAKMQNHPAITLTGYQSDVRPFLAVSQVLAFPSYREGFPNVPMQAGAMGLPSIVTDINGCNEIVKDRFNGLLIPAKNEEALLKAMMHLIEDKLLYKELSTNARESITSRYEQQSLWKEIKAEYDIQLKSAGLSF